MKKILLSLAVVACSLLSFAQTNPMVWNNGRMQCAQPITNIDSLTYSLPIVESDTLQLILPRAVEVEQVKHVKVTLPKYDTTIVVQHDTIYSKPYTVYAGYAASAFSVSDSKKVAFSKGNLQYTQSTSTWAFAENQYDMIGADNVSNSTLADKIDLFGWSTNNAATPWGISTSTANADYLGDFVDWGKNIGDGNTWRTLSVDEWVYLFTSRTNAATLFGLGTVNGVKGTIILPDNWTCPTGVTFTPSTQKGLTYDATDSKYTNSNENNYSHNTYTLAKWRQLEQTGAVFLPATGCRFGTSISALTTGAYWSSSTIYIYTSWAHHLVFDSKSLQPKSYMTPNYSMSVRLVKDL